MKLVEIIRYDRERQTVFVTRSLDYENHWRIGDDEGPEGWERVCPKHSWPAGNGLHNRMIDGERHYPTYPVERPWFFKRAKLNMWRAEYQAGWRTARPAKPPTLRPLPTPMQLDFSGENSPSATHA